MQISVARPGELGPEEVAAWHSMQRSTESLANPFLSPEFAMAVDKFRSNTRVAVLTEGPEITGFFPFERRKFRVGAPIAAGLTDCQGLIHKPDAEWDPRELLRACSVSMWQFDHLVEGQLPFKPFANTASPSPVIDLTDGFAAYEDKLRTKSPQFCKDVARKARKLEREVGELRFTVDSRKNLELRSLMAWKSDQYHRNGWVDVFARPWIAELIDYLFSIRNDHFSGLLSVLYAGQDPVAAHFGLQSGHVLAHWYPGYDARFAKQSPGLIQHLRMAAGTAALGIRLIDMGTGAERYKQTLRSYDIFVASGTVTRGSVVASTHKVSNTLGDWARRQIRQYPPLFRAADRVLRHYGRIG